ncbi:MAG: PilZ domain-containing protein [Candidatus Tectimicrobiota bacterium]
MTILEAENQSLRRRTRELETELRHVKTTHVRLQEENEQLKDRIKVLERQLQPGVDGRTHERIEATFRVDSVNSRGEVAMGVARNVSLGGAYIETDLRLLPGELMVVTFELLGRPFKLQAEVVRVMESGFGVRFSVDPQQQAQLRAAITRL